MMTREFEDTDTNRNQNPIMHLTEALLALSELSGDKKSLERACDLVDFLFAPSLDRQDKALPKFYYLNWQPLPCEKNPGANVLGNASMGHQLEWAYLISWAVESGFQDSYLKYAQFVLKAGLEFGYDNEYGGLLKKSEVKGKTYEVKGWWNHTETIRTLLHFVMRHDRYDLLPRLKQTVEFFQDYLHDSEYGGIFPTVSRDGKRVLKDEKGSLGKLDYHTVAMIREILHLQSAGKDLY